MKIGSHRTDGAAMANARNTARSFTALLDEPPLDATSSRDRRQAWASLLLPLGIAILAVGTWSATAPLSGAVVAPGQVKVESNRRTVQHQEGGIVREILVRDGQKVRAGDALVVIGNVRSDSELVLLQDQQLAERIRQARVAAEATLQPRFDVDESIAGSARAAEALARERALFAARRRTLDEQVGSLQSQVRHVDEQVAALASQVSATEASGKLAGDELEINEKLVAQGFIQRTRLLALQRDASDYRSRLGEQRGDLAVARQRISELGSRIVQTRNQYQTQAADELKESTARLREIEERLRPTQDTAERQVLRAPVDGEVMNLHASALGQAIGPREPVADVVPDHEALVIEARIRPQDIDHVHKGGNAEVRIDAFDARSVPMLPGRVTFVSPDRTSSADGRDAWFVATVEVEAAALKKNAAQIRLKPGMAAELYVATGERSLLEYLSKPLGIFMHRAMRET